MTNFWSRPIREFNINETNYWGYFGNKLVEHSCIPLGASVLDVACGSGSSLYSAAEKTGTNGHIVGIDICSCPN